mgnify:CR=1 FL=1
MIFFNVELIDRICKQIYQSKRIIMYGAMGLLNLTHDFQIDMKLFGKDFIRSSMYEDKALSSSKRLICMAFFNDGKNDEYGRDNNDV